MQTLAAVVKAALIPGSDVFLILGLVAGVALLYLGPRASRWGRRGLTALAALYLALSLPIASNALVAGLQADYGSIQNPGDAKGARVVVVIGNGAFSYVASAGGVHQLAGRTVYCVLEAVRLYRLIQPRWIVASGGVADPDAQTRPESEMMRDELVKLGVPADRILLESESRRTAEQIANVAQLLRAQRLPEPVVLVTTPAHMRRVMLMAPSQAIDAVPSVAAEPRYDNGHAGWRRWRPSRDALRGSESAIYEYMALIFAYAWPHSWAGG